MKMRSCYSLTLERFCLSPDFLPVNHTTLLSSTGLPSQLQKAFPKTNVHVGRRFLAKICFFIQKIKKTNSKSTPTIPPSPGRPPQVPTQRLPDQAGGASSSPGCTAKTSQSLEIHTYFFQVKMFMTCV